MNVEPDDNSLLPARMINEAVYCARLFWLEHVAGEWRESHDTLDGTRIHRRVDRPTRRDRAALEGDEEPTVARSVTLSSSSLGVIAKNRRSRASWRGGDAGRLQARKRSKCYRRRLRS